MDGPKENVDEFFERPTEFGLADIENDVPVTANTRFGIASVTKLFTAVTLLKLLMDWFGDKDDAGRTFILATGSNPGVQAGLAVYPEAKISSAILANTWGLGSRSAEMVYLARELSQTVANWQNLPIQ